MESDDDYQSFPLPEEASPEIRRPRFKRLKKALEASKNRHAPPAMPIDEVSDFPKVDFAKLEALEASKTLEEDSADSTELVSSSQGSEDATRSEYGFDEKGGESREQLEALEASSTQEDSADSTELVSPHNSEDEKGGEDVLVSSEQSKEVKRFLDFGEDDDQSRGKEHETSREVGEDLESGDVAKEMEDLDMEKLGTQQDVEGDGDLKEDDKTKKNKKKRTKGDIGSEVKPKELASNKRREAKERKIFLQQLHADTQRLLRESKDAAFKPVPVVNKPISSVLEKIRKRKLEVLKKTGMLSSNSSIHKISASSEVMMELGAKNAYSEEQRVDKLDIELGEKVDVNDIETDRTTDTSNIDGILVSPITRSSEIAPDQMALDERPNAVFRAPVDDTQDLFDDSEQTGSKDEMLDDPASSPLEEVMAPSLLALNLKFDSAPPDESSSDEEDNDKENINPYTKEGGDGCSSPKGDPVKAFVDDEAEEEDDSDNDLLRFGDEEDDDIDDSAELHDMIATDYKENPVDKEKRNELHQKWLEQQDAAGTENLLQRLKCGVEQKETMLVDDELESDECDEEVNNVTDTDAIPKSSARLNSKKAKQIIMQMFVDKDEVYLSDEDEETEKRLVKQRMLYNSELTTVVSPIEDESSSELFGLIKKLNTVPDNKRKAKASSFFDTVLGDQKKKSSLKSSFLGRVTNHLPSSHKQSSTIVRSFIFGRDDSNSRSSMSMSEDSSDMIVKENLPIKNSTTKFGNFQAKSSSQGKNAAAGTSADAPLFDILKRSSAASNVCSRDVLLDLPKTLLADLRVSKRSLKAEGKR
ncbi:PREDICTED: protein IWS1 homolog isoform X2 [Nicotiana attenuata]|uniref:protein IWS1 homolog isoform X2 n=1 Tax=Nicotiana attenuata TaxID=49451 RepID=UPI0009047FD4|nr:PREDICTED: protein IWS1 homolog isoform X2 [Nicotiana attenuata]